MGIPDDFIARILTDLRPREREVLGLRYLNGFSVPEIAVQLGIRPDSVSGHSTKGLSKIGAVLGAPQSKTRQAGEAVLEHLGEVLTARRPARVVSTSKGRVRVQPSRYVIGAAVHADAYLGGELLRYFVSHIDDVPIASMNFDAWREGLPVRESSAIRRMLLDLKKIKPSTKYDKEQQGYFFPIGFGCPELYFDRDFDHEPECLVAPDENGTMVWHRRDSPILQPTPEYRPMYLSRWYMPRVFDLGEYRRAYEDDLASDYRALSASA